MIVSVRSRSNSKRWFLRILCTVLLNCAWVLNGFVPNCTIGMFSEIAYRRILVYSFCLIIIGLSLSIMKLIKWNFWILKEHNNFSYFWNLSPICQIVSEKFFFEKPPNLQRMYELINVLPPSNFAVFNWCYFLFYWLQRAETCTTA